MRVALAGMLVALAAGAAAARPSVPPAPRPIALVDDGRRLVISVAFPDLFDAALGARLDSGFATNIVVRAFVGREGAGRAEALAVRHTRVAYDLWDEVYLVEERDDAGVRTARLGTRAQAIARVTTLDRLPVGEWARLRPGVRYVVRVVVEVNPVSPELLARVRRWLTRPEGSRRLDSSDGGESFFGSLVSVFVNPRIGDAEKVLRFETPPFVRQAGAAGDGGKAGGEGK
jgi:hypothetical protein